MAFRRHTIAELDLVCLSIDEDPVHDGCLVCDAADEAGVSRIRVRKIVSLERVSKWLVMSGAGVDEELQKPS